MNNNLGYPTHNLVKTLDIEIDEEYIYSGVALSRLSRAPYNGCAFPLVRRIVLLLVTNGCLTEGMKTESNTVAFVQRIKEMVPNVNDIWVRPLDCDAPRYNTSHIYGRLVTLLFPLVGHIQYSRAVMPMMPAALLSSIACNLVHIKCTVVNNDKNFIKLAQHSSTTLESLVIDSKRCINTPSIIWKEDGDFVTYPHLHTFKLSGPSIGDEMSQPVPTGVVPFSSLRCLKIDYEYTFGDDAVFKGNAATLESLDLYLGDSAISVLRQYNVFTPTSHLKLRYVRTWNPSDLVPCVFATNVEAINFVMGIGLTASRRGIGGYQNGAKIIPTLSQLDGLASIQVLSLAATELHLWDVIALIKGLPMMSDLTVWSSSVGPLPDDVTLDELPAYVISTYAPMGERFRCRHIDSCIQGPFTVEAKCALLLALACPNFTLVTASHQMRKKFVEQLKTEIASNMFKPYAPRLQCFIY